MLKSKADEIRDIISEIASIRERLNKLYESLPEKEQSSIRLAIYQLEVGMRKMEKRLLVERLKELIP